MIDQIVDMSSNSIRIKNPYILDNLHKNKLEPTVEGVISLAKTELLHKYLPLILKDNHPKPPHCWVIVCVGLRRLFMEKVG